MVNKIHPIPLENINGGFDAAILIGKKPGFKYVDGKRQGDVPVCHKLEVLLHGNCMTPLTVTVNGSTDQLASISEQDIFDSCENLDFIFVRFSRCVVSIYAIDGLKMTATADSVEIVKPKSGK